MRMKPTDDLAEHLGVIAVDGVSISNNIFSPLFSEIHAGNSRLRTDPVIDSTPLLFCKNGQWDKKKY